MVFELSTLSPEITVLRAWLGDVGESDFQLSLLRSLGCSRQVRPEGNHYFQLSLLRSLAADMDVAYEYYPFQLSLLRSLMPAQDVAYLRLLTFNSLS